MALYYIAEPTGNIDMGGIAGSYGSLLLLGSVFCALGMLSSACSGHPLASFLLATFLSAMLYDGLPALSTAAGPFGGGVWMEKLGISYHYESLSKGLVKSSELVFFLVVIVFMLFLLTMLVERRK